MGREGKGGSHYYIYLSAARARRHTITTGGGKLGEDIKSLFKRISFMMLVMIPTDLLLMADSFVCEGGCVCWWRMGYGVPEDR